MKIFTYAFIFDTFGVVLYLYVEVKFSIHLKPPTTILGKFWYPNLVGSFEVSQKEFWHPKGSSTW
jgi:hypothetical protein